MSHKLSSRIQGLKFMQRAAQRASGNTTEPTDVTAPPETKAENADESTEAWVVPAKYRIKTVTSQPSASWDAWLMDAHADDVDVPRPRKFGRWEKRAQTRDEPLASNDASDDDYDDDEDDDVMDDASETSRRASAAFRKPPSAHEPMPKRRAVAAPPHKQAPVADRKHGQRKKVTRLR